ncbi:MAG: FIST N-terminal domain-containing protein [Myxococcales bacterium]|nr:FIST C-terminal domain-containing protein [Myxococcota bacterium]MDW8281041.1 FIST N-terminal domain-containing protein [Myxococcales bacterium]
MELATLSYHPQAGWSVPAFPPLDSDQTLLLVFVPARLAWYREALVALAAAYPRSVLLGCSTAAAVCGRMLQPHSLSAAVVRLERSSLRQVTLEPMGDATEAAHALGAQLRGAGLRAVLLLADGAERGPWRRQGGLGGLSSALCAVLPPDVVVIGCRASDDGAGEGGFLLTRDILCQEAQGSDAPPEQEARIAVVSAVAFYGEALRMRGAVGGGWSPAGPARIVTRAHGTRLYELDGQPALRRYLDDLGIHGMPAPMLGAPLLLRRDGPSQPGAVRAVLSLEEEEQALVLAEEVPAGPLWAQALTMAPEDLIAGARSAAAALGGIGSGSGVPSLALVLGCRLRSILLGPQAELEISAVREALPRSCVLVGCLGDGQIGPSLERYPLQGQLGPSELHNEVLSLLWLSEEEGA